MKLRRNIINIIALAALLLLVLALTWLSFGGGTDTAPVVLPSPVAADGDGDDSPGKNKTHSTVNITANTVQAVIATLQRADSYTRTLTVHRFWSGGESETNIDVYVSGSSTKAVIREFDSEKHVLVVGEDLWIWRTGESGIFTGKASENADDEFQSIPTYEDILLLDKGDITGAGYVEYGAQYCVFVEYVSGILQYKTKVYIPIDTGLVSGCERYDGEELVYSVTSSSVSLITPDDEVFSIPENS